MSFIDEDYRSDAPFNQRDVEMVTRVIEVVETRTCTIEIEIPEGCSEDLQTQLVREYIRDYGYEQEWEETLEWEVIV